MSAAVLSDKFRHHHMMLGQYLSGIDAVMAHAVASEQVFHRGVRAQWAALHQLALDQVTILTFIAQSETECAWLESFAERRAELELAYDAHRDALDFSK